MSEAQLGSPRHLADLDPAARRAAVLALGAAPYRADQLFRAYLAGATLDGAVPGAGPLAVLPGPSRDALCAALLPPLLRPVEVVACDGGATRKTVWRLAGGAVVESVLMGYPDRVTVCVSSQAGCGMGCPFCATGQAGLTRNLSAGEIVEQVVAARVAAARGDLGTGPARLDHVVFMGMGEPLANYDRLLAAVRVITAAPPGGLGLSQRNVTISTVGLVPGIDRLAAAGVRATLAISLHAPVDELRDTLVPVNRRWPVHEVLEAGWRYTAATGRRLSIEYALIRGVNDSADLADALARLLRGRLVHVNLIPLNPTPGSAWDASPLPVQREFTRRLLAAGIATTVRDTRGREVAAACGQLAGSAAGAAAGAAGG
ncbi:MAG: 23S rRNA (adenine(2503)-C(2))-methyltransferase RlmN [Mycobacteriales bacterium]